MRYIEEYVQTAIPPRRLRDLPEFAKDNIRSLAYLLGTRSDELSSPRQVYRPEIMQIIANAAVESGIEGLVIEILQGDIEAYNFFMRLTDTTEERMSEIAEINDVEEIKSRLSSIAYESCNAMIQRFVDRSQEIDRTVQLSEIDIENFIQLVAYSENPIWREGYVRD